MTRVLSIAESSSPPWVAAGWLEITTDRWPEVARYWGGVREHMADRYELPMNVPVLQALPVGRGRRVMRRVRRRQSLAYAVRAVGAAEGVGVGSVYAPVGADDEPHLIRRGLLWALLDWMDHGLTADGEHALVLLDTDSELPQHHVWESFVEAPIRARGTRAGEMAELVAWTAVQYRRLGADPDFCWDVYRDLRAVDVHGEPVALDIDDEVGREQALVRM